MKKALIFAHHQLVEQAQGQAEQVPTVAEPGMGCMCTDWMAQQTPEGLCTGLAYHVRTRAVVFKAVLMTDSSIQLPREAATAVGRSVSSDRVPAAMLI